MQFFAEKTETLNFRPKFKRMIAADNMISQSVCLDATKPVTGHDDSEWLQQKDVTNVSNMSNCASAVALLVIYLLAQILNVTEVKSLSVFVWYLAGLHINYCIDSHWLLWPDGAWHIEEPTKFSKPVYVHFVNLHLNLYDLLILTNSIYSLLCWVQVTEDSTLCWSQFTTSTWVKLSTGKS